MMDGDKKPEYSNFGYSLEWNTDGVGIATIVLSCKCGHEQKDTFTPGDDGDITCSECGRVYDVEWVGVKLTEVAK